MIFLKAEKNILKQLPHSKRKKKRKRFSALEKYFFCTKEKKKEIKNIKFSFLKDPKRTHHQKRICNQ
jgi:hypothetical protein